MIPEVGVTSTISAARIEFSFCNLTTYSKVGGYGPESYGKPLWTKLGMDFDT